VDRRIGGGHEADRPAEVIKMTVLKHHVSCEMKGYRNDESSPKNAFTNQLLLGPLPRQHLQRAVTEIQMPQRGIRNASIEEFSER
jgi:hypothetical protein